MNNTTTNTRQTGASEDRIFATVYRIPYTNLATVVLALIGVGTALVAFLASSWETRTFETSATMATTTQIQDLKSDLAQSRTLIEAIESKLRSITELPDEAKSGVKLTAIEQQISMLQEKIARMETAVMDNPERAMSIPMLRKDLEALGLELRGDIEGVGKEIERIYDLGQWIIGAAVIPLGLGLFTVAMGRIRPPKDKEASAP